MSFDFSTGTTGEQSEVLVAFYLHECAPIISELVDSQLANPGMTSSEVLQDMFSSLESIFGKLNVPKVHGKLTFMAPFGRQLSSVFHRAVTLKSRSKGELIASLASTIIKGVILGVAFLNINKQAPL
jgi:hypothetical protein